MKKTLFIASAIIMTSLFSGCSTEKTTPPQELTQAKATNKVGEEVLVMTEGNQKIVQGKTANIKGEAKFDKVENSTLTFFDGISEISEVIRDSSITIKDGGVLKTPYIKFSTIIVEKGGDLQIKERMKETKVILKGGDFSIRPVDMDEKSSVIQE